MIERVANDPAFTLGWVTGDEAFGDSGPLRANLEGSRLNYVVAVSCDHQVTLPGRKHAPTAWSQVWTPTRGSGTPAGTVPRANGTTTWFG